LPADLEQLSEEGHIDLYYGDESHVCSQGYVPYGWQFPDEEVYIPSEKAYRINCPGFINRKSEYMGTMTENNINAEFVMEYPEKFSFTIQKETVIVLDNAGVHKAKIIRERIPFWQNRGLFIAFLPPYSPHLNIAETVWRKLKKEWLNPEDYLNKDTLCYAANRCLATLGHEFKINFSHFNINLF
jgi:transposase